MKKVLMTVTLLSTLLICLPGRADCPSDKENHGKKSMPVKAKVVEKPKCYTVPVEPFWHDEHWFE